MKKNYTLETFLIFVVSIICIVFAFRIAYYQHEAEVKTLQLIDAKNVADNIIMRSNREKQKQDEIIQHLANSQLHEYTVIDDRYIIRVPIYDIKRIKGPVCVFDLRSNTHTVYYLNKDNTFRQPIVIELVNKFETMD